MKTVRSISIIVMILISTACTKQADVKFLSSDFQRLDGTASFETTILDSAESRWNEFQGSLDDTLILTTVNYFDSLSQFTDNQNNDKAKILWDKVRSHYLAGNVNYLNYNYIDAIRDYLEALELLDKYFGSSDNLVSLMYGKIYFQISELFYHSEYFEISRQAAEFGLKHALASHDSAWTARSYWKLADVCDMMASSFENDTAIYYLKLGRHFASRENNPYETALLMSKYADCLRHNRKRDSADYYFRHAIAITPKGNNLLYENYLHLGFVFYLDGKLDSAVKYVSKAYESEHFSTRRSASWGLADIYQRTGDMENAALFSARQREYQVKLDLAKKHNSEIISLFNNYIKGLENGKDNSFILNVILIAMMFVVVVAALLFYLKIRNQRRRNQEMEQGRIRLKAESVSAKETLENKQDTVIDNELEKEKEELLLIQRRKFMETEIYKSVISRCPKKMSPDVLKYEKMKFSQAEWDEYMRIVRLYFPDYQHVLQTKYQIVSQAELEYCYLSLLDVSESCKAALLGISYQGIASRRARAAETLGCRTRDINKVLGGILVDS